MTCCTVHKCEDSPQCEWEYKWSDFQLGWITFCILCTCVVSLHCGWARVGLCDCRIVALVAFVWILSSVCFAVISHERLFRWKSCIGCTYGHRQQGQEFRMTLLEAKIGFIHCIGNSFGEETTEVLCQRMSEDLFNEIMFLSDVIWSRDSRTLQISCERNYCISVILKLVQFEPAV